MDLLSANITANISDLFHAFVEEGYESSDHSYASLVSLMQWPAVATCATVLMSVCLIYGTASPTGGDPSFPAMGHGNLKNRHKEFAEGGGWDHYVEGYRAFKNRIFRVAIGPETERIVLPAKFLPELNKLPESTLSFENLLEERVQAKHFVKDEAEEEGVASEPPTFSVKLFTRAALSSSLPRFTSLMLEGVLSGFQRELPETKSDWEEVQIYKSIARVVMRTCGRIFVGPDICNTETYLNVAPRFLDSFVRASAITNALPSFLRPVLAPYMPQVREWNRNLSAITELLRPEIRQRVADMAELGDAYEKPDDMLQCILDVVKPKPEHGRQGEDVVALTQMSGSTVAIDSPVINIMNAVYTLAAQPELLPMLREDIRQGIESTGELNHEALQKMMKLDSFIKEVMRVYPMRANSFQRKVLRPFALSDGHVIEAGSEIEVSWAGIKDDPEYYPNPHRFDALRFYNLRLAEESETNSKSVNRLVGTSKTDLSWGFGKHACPGRYLAANELRVVLAALILDYDLRMPDGVEGRYENPKDKSQQGPDPKHKVMVKKL